ncbi:60S ribosomal protein L6 [Coemansia sp. RSA 1813]|nr:60S ribosomal protein L6 [Coemansia sp. RSA 1646]KAJ1771087.1 60S ribosomal protein L6 [Coemansia sp. RSA 1843]KAJ2089831.1 60S ribosomal protein L6 [Coemansia sp. RSA 986]KAJ2214784.1 60S ribosomal protein L6 [Coemansia sp. RSA 487]KAJ2569771.1 60S ribosomal protein L6 [Coemansia sp. RSA 1813]
MANSARKNQLAPGISRLSRSKVFSKRAAYKIAKEGKAKVVEAEEPKAPKRKSTKGDLVDALTAKSNGLYPANIIPKSKTGRKAVRAPKLRKSITPGTVLILLAGRFRGKRVVFLKQLKSGLLLVTGPFKINGVPLRRVNQAYAVATSTKVDISGIKVDSKINDEYFKGEKEAKLKGTEEEFFGKDAKKKEHPAHKIADQKVVDKDIVAAVAKVPFLASYLASSFSLSKGQAPHTLKF